jgi:hypothetical protein
MDLGVLSGDRRMKQRASMQKEKNMNNWIFRIKFSGLTAFVMRPEGSTPGARVFLMNALDIPGKKHRPELRFDARDEQPSPGNIPLPTGDIFETGFPKKKRWMLKSLDLNFLPAPGSALKQPFELDPSIDTYLLRFTDIMSDAGEIDPRCFDPVPPPNLVAVRVPLMHGKLTATTLAFEPFREWVECGFAPQGNYSCPIPRTQYCAIELTLEFPVEEGPLTLVGVPFDSNSRPSGIAFEPPAGKREVVVELENRPVGPEKSRQISDHREMDEDFSLYYELSHCIPNEEKRVVPIYDHIKRVESGNCIIGRFADDPNA